MTLAVKEYYVKTQSKEESEHITYSDLRQRAVELINKDRLCNIINVIEIKSDFTVQPVMSNSDTWYRAIGLKLVVYYFS